MKDIVSMIAKLPRRKQIAAELMFFAYCATLEGHSDVKVTSQTIKTDDRKGDKLIYTVEVSI